MRKKFKKIYIEITNRCNLSCSFCPPTKRPGAMMTPEQFAAVLDAIKPWTDYIYLHVKGEPLLHPQLGALLATAREKGLYVNLTTNGTLLPKAAPTLMAHPARQINLSLHSFEANDLKPLGMTFTDYIMSTLDFAKAYSPEFGITCLRLWNLDPEQMSAPQREKNTLILDAIRRTFEFDGSLDHRDYAYRDVRLAERTYLSFDHEFCWPALDAPDFGPDGSCHGLKSHIAILCDGTVVPCCLDGDGIIDLGNIFQNALEEILNTPRAQALVTGFQNRHIEEPLCRRCGYRTRFT